VPVLSTVPTHVTVSPFLALPASTTFQPFTVTSSRWLSRQSETTVASPTRCPLEFLIDFDSNRKWRSIRVPRNESPRPCSCQVRRGLLRGCFDVEEQEDESKNANWAFGCRSLLSSCNHGSKASRVRAATTVSIKVMPISMPLPSSTTSLTKSGFINSSRRISASSPA
jgi:hypothetical protein